MRTFAEMNGPPRYPGVRVKSRTRNPLAMVALVRHALRTARVGRDEIEQFSSQALEPSPEHQREGRQDTEELCRQWVDWVRN